MEVKKKINYQLFMKGNAVGVVCIKLSPNPGIMDTLHMEKIIIADPPIALKRPRFATRSGKAFDSQKKMKETVKWDIHCQWTKGPIKTPIKLDIGCFVQIPASWSKKKKESHMNKFCLVRPDIDNYIKFYLDCMNGLVFDDDSQVVYLRAYKIYSDNPRTEIIIEHGSDVVESEYG